METPAKTIALIHNAALPHPLGVLSTAIASHAHKEYLSSNVPPNYQIQIIDLAEFNLLTSGLTSPASPPLQSADVLSHTGKSVAEWMADMSKHSGLILLFPYHTWSTAMLLDLPFHFFLCMRWRISQSSLWGSGRKNHSTPAITGGRGRRNRLG